MKKWINAKELADMLGLKLAMGKRIIQNRRYKKQPLIVRTEKSTKGKPTAFVLWATETNQPAISSEEANYEKPAASVESATKQAPKPVDLPVCIPLQDTLALPGDPAIAIPKKTDAKQPAQPILREKAQTNALFQRKDMALNDQSESIGAGLAPALLADPLQEISDQETSQDPPDFETLLHRKICEKKKNTQRALSAYYRKQYKATGEIPVALLVGEGRRFAGRKRSIDIAVQSRFIDMVMKAADKDDIFHYYTKGTRKVSIFHTQLEKEFGKKLSIQQLYTVVRACNLKPYLDMLDDEEDTQKLPSFFKAEPVGSLVQVDGVEADYLEIWVDDKWCKPIWIEFFDLGSRKLLAMHAYLSESSENSVDIFTRFLSNNTFAHKQMSIRPDQAGGFRNLRRPIKELNNRYAVPNGFTFLDDFARAGAPKDKAHLESSHRAFHGFEGTIIKHFRDKIDSQYKKQKKTGNQLKTVTVTRLNISLEELNDSGITADYMAHHNSRPHRFSEDGVQKTWIPDDRWNAHLSASKTFKFTTDDIELCRRYGHTKASATINTTGLITYKKQQYYVENKELWSSHSSTKIKISLIDDHLAIFNASDEGVYRGDAKALQEPVKSEKLINRDKAKVEKIHNDNKFFSIIKLLKEHGMIVDEGKEGKGGKLRQMLENGLTVAAVGELLAEDAEKYEQYRGTFAGFNMFSSRVTRYLSKINPPKLVPYAGAPVDEAKK